MDLPTTSEEWAALVQDAGKRAAALKAHARECDVVAASEAKGESALLLARAFAHPRDASIRFHEASHSYFLNGRKVPISVSGLWGRYFEHFNEAEGTRGIERWRADPKSPYFLLLRHMDLAGVPRDQQAARIRQLWRSSGAHASDAGTALHRAIELRLNGLQLAVPPYEAPAWRLAKGSRWYNLLSFLAGEEPPAQERALCTVAASASVGVEEALELLRPVQGEEFEHFLDWREARPNLVPVRCEMNVWSEELDLAGQLDALFWDEMHEHFVLVDWKRVEKLEREAYGGRTGKPPFQKVPDTSLGHYYVQQNVYAHLLRLHYGVDCARMFLVQLHPTLDSWKEHEVPDLRQEVDHVFKERAAEVLQSKLILYKW
jgi:hypothetical protein